MNRNFTNIIRFGMDECLPAIIRDSKWFMYPFMVYAFKGTNVKKHMEFKSYAWRLSDQEFSKIYNEVECIGNDRDTDLNTACIEMIAQALQMPNGGAIALKVLDVGCGRGFLAEKIIKLGHEVEGCDALDSVQIPKMKYTQALAEKLPYADQSFDVVVCTHTLEHVRNLDLAISELKRVAKTKLIIVVPKQRPFYYTLDLHLQFFPYERALTDRIGLDSFLCKDVGGDWYYEASLGLSG